MTNALRAAFRHLWRQPGFSLNLIGMLGLGLAIAVTMFSVLKAVVLERLPYADPERVVVFNAHNARQSASAMLTSAEAAAMATESEVFDRVARYNWSGETVVVSGERPREFTVATVTGDFFPILSPNMLLGRPVEQRDLDADVRVIVLSHREWQRSFGGDPNVIGKKMPLAYGDAEVIGVLPPSFQFPGSDVDGWLPMFPRFEPKTDSPVYPNARYVPTIGLLKPGVDLAQANAAAARVAARMREQYRLEDIGWRPVVSSALEDLLGETRVVLWGCFAVALLVLLIACTNAGLALQARAVARSREHAVALALGASRRLLLTVTVVELFLLSVAATLVALIITQGVTTALAQLLADILPRGEGIRIDWSVAAIALALALVAVAVSSLLGARMRADASEVLRSGRGQVGLRSRWLKLGPAIGIAMSTVALITAAALTLSVLSLSAVSLGFRTEGIQILQLFRDGGPAEWRRYAPAVAQVLAATPGVEKHAYTTAAPLSVIGRFELDAMVAGRSEVEPYQALMRGVSPGYRDLLDVPLVSGRDLSAADTEQAPMVALINETLARQSFGSESPIGKQLLLPLGPGARKPATVVGVMKDHRNRGPRSAVQAEMWLPFDQAPWVGVSFVVASPLPAMQVQQALEQAITEVAPEEAATRKFSLAGDASAQTGLTTLLTRILLAFAVSALFLAAFGIYALTTLTGRARVPEFGLRLAIGARPKQLAHRLIHEALSLTGAGFVFGALVSWLVLRLLESQLFGLGALPWSSYLVTGLVLLIAVLGATALPAWRVARLSPMQSLRSD
ncbi:MAG: ABC transporter permease [Ahniella sp.]|nr:ABC transporter permease [Ahniella sp.]